VYNSAGESRSNPDRWLV